MAANSGESVCIAVAYQAGTASNGGRLELLGVTVVLLRWRRSSEDELSSAMAPAALGAGTAAATGEEEGRGEANGVLG